MLLPKKVASPEVDVTGIAEGKALIEAISFKKRKMTYPMAQDQKQLNPGIAMRKKDQEIGPFSPGQAVEVKIKDLGDKTSLY